MKKLKMILVMMIISSAAMCQQITIANNNVCITGEGVVVLSANSVSGFSAKILDKKHATIAVLKKQNEALRMQLNIFKKKEAIYEVAKKSSPKKNKNHFK